MDVGEFVGWGGWPWRHMVQTGVDALGSVEGLRVLEIGGRRGEMAVYFALRGALVTSADLEDQFAEGRQLAEHHGVQHRVDFVQYDGDPDSLESAAWDVVFTKSVLAVLRDKSGNYTSTGYRDFVPAIERRLVAGGKVLLVENAKGPMFTSFLRRVTGRTWGSAGAPYFTMPQLRLTQDLFETILLKRWLLPPIVTYLGRKGSPR